MSSNNIGGNTGNDASGIDWKRIALPDLLKQMDDSIEVQIAKVNEQSRRRRDKIMKRAAKQEAQRKAEEEKRKAEEEAKQKAEEEEKQKAEENKCRAEEEYRAQAEVKRKQKADAAKIAQEGAQGTKPRPRWAVSQRVPNEGIKGWHPPCDHCRRSGDSKGCVLPPDTHSPTCGRCHLAKIKCHFEVSISTMERLTSREKRKESETSATAIETLPRGGEKRKRMKKVVAEAVSTEEIEKAMGSFSVAGPSTRLDPVAQVLDRRLGEVIAAINHNTRELAWLGSRMDGFAWEMQRLADAGDRKGKGKVRAEEPKDEEERSEKTEESEDGRGKDEEEDAQHDADE
ncbi:hypothetical protein SCLCIDRAFT_26794 [Scleroderma citrinum Foug A]|uniref:Uncharacterized protein n=1 Tax=Scleroderma citrinum Foug A TaxID=1036808 RepID=A0A0C3DVF5_9AGAM|nr:hypothetical protein SCLCIDRAFT_26794 [Scleroderma citrinum Foug A]